MLIVVILNLGRSIRIRLCFVAITTMRILVIVRRLLIILIRLMILLRRIVILILLNIHTNIIRRDIIRGVCINTMLSVRTMVLRLLFLL